MMPDLLALGNQLTIYWGVIALIFIGIIGLVLLYMNLKQGKEIQEKAASVSRDSWTLRENISAMIESLKEQAANEAVICRFCGSANKIGAVFCEECNQALFEVAEYEKNMEFVGICKICGCVNSSYDIFCIDCDTPLFLAAELMICNSEDPTRSTQTVALSGDIKAQMIVVWRNLLEELKNPRPDCEKDVLLGIIKSAHVVFQNDDSPEVKELLDAFDALSSVIEEPAPVKYDIADMSKELFNHAMEKILGAKCNSDLFYQDGSIGFQSGMILQDTEQARKLIEESFKDNGSEGVKHLIDYFEPVAEKNVQPETASEQQTATLNINIAELDKALNIVVTNNPDNPATILEVTAEILEGIKHDSSFEAIALRLRCGYIRTAILNEGAKISEEAPAEIPTDETANSKLDKDIIQSFRLELMGLIHDSKGDNTAVKNYAYEILLQIAEDTSDEADAFRKDIEMLLSAIEIKKQVLIRQNTDEEPPTAAPLNYTDLRVGAERCDTANSPENLKDQFEKCARIREFFQKNWDELNIIQQACAQKLGFKKGTWKSNPKKFKKIRVTTFLNLEFSMKEAIDKLDFTMEEWDAFASWSKAL
ncbi:MAG TPA: hypothetical protein P5096_02045 [Patescibacteria group bacterium]|nr:hypothetical protein [Patescibacteria group bacterium]